MAARPFLLNFGQSNSGPFHPLDDWLPARPDLNLIVSPGRVSGGYAPNFTMPGNFPGYGTRPLKGLAIDTIRYLTFYNPVASGYTSYPGTGRVVEVASPFAHSVITVYVEQQFDRGTHQIASIVRKLDNRAYTVVGLLTPAMTFGTSDVDIGTDVITIPKHGLITGDVLTFTSSGTLPAGLLLATEYTVNAVPDEDTFTLLSVNLTNVGTGTHTAHSAMPTRAGSRLKFDLAEFWFPQVPQSLEEFTYAITAVGGSTSSAQLNLGFGVLKDGDLLGLELTVAGASRVVSAWDNTTRTATLAGAAITAPTGGEAVTIQPQGGIAFKDYCFFLPWCPFETDLSAVLGKINPYPPGFDFPNHFHLPQVYSTDAQTPTAVTIDGTPIPFYLTVFPWISWHVGGGVRFAEALGEPLLIISCDFGGTSTAHNERQIGQEVVGWYDKAQQSDWDTARANSCFARLRDELAAAKVAAAAVGDTLYCVGVVRVQADGDASLGSDPTYGGIDENPEQRLWPEKFLESNRTLRRKVRQLLVDLELWEGAAEEIPWVQQRLPKEFDELVIGDTESVTIVNAALQQLADEDPYAETFDPSGIPKWDGNHYTGRGLTQIEDLTFDAWQRILKANDRSGEIRICNLALTHIGEAAVVTSINPPDGSAQAQHCALYYPIARNAVLEAFAWKFATKRRPLFLARENDTTAWDYAYSKPADALRVLSIVPAGQSDDYIAPPQLSFTSREALGLMLGSAVVPQPYVQGVLLDGTQVIYTNVPDAEIRYVARVLDTSRYPDTFVMAVSWYLASLLAGVTVKGTAGAALGDRCVRMAQSFIAAAGSSDGNQQKVELDPSASWIQARQ